MGVQASAISRAGVQDVCRRPWGSEEEARSAAGMLHVAGWQVGWHDEPVPLDGGRWSVATVLSREGGCIGEVTYG